MKLLNEEGKSLDIDDDELAELDRIALNEEIESERAAEDQELVGFIKDEHDAELALLEEGFMNQVNQNDIQEISNAINDSEIEKKLIQEEFVKIRSEENSILKPE